jgi:serine/threonine protein kinase
MTNKAGADPTIVGNYQLVKKLGKGAYGTVKLGIHVKTGEKVQRFVSLFLKEIHTRRIDSLSVALGSSEDHQNKTHQNTEGKTNGRTGEKNSY